ncbi:hypothetical protein ASPZODRAFT_20375 [Penicilliopsis zonata CBS 506.65]|uniref:Lysine-specific metallo-endopeptidase domain-containing protein n=1 Tax=Penicilliopsis zonata CBS 506.65 TaxID=1073090 RepID=A0A1L9S623_9EURO|nr:hypothetical protein ASPZODRAFT_20375 [Penicilliopsis zonata CBS 506.65]OJJ42606.1 hypothetical protein ASPZODRAFT_20375 [Penicilliopsis zonata CBS 506.65]
MARFCLLFVFLLLFSWTQASEFDIVYTEEVPATCYGLDARLNKWEAEAKELYSTGMQAVLNVGTNLVAQKSFTAFLGVEFHYVNSVAVPVDQNLFNKVQTTISLANNFLSGRGYPQMRVKPRVYCGDEFLQQRQWTDIALDSTGEKVKRPESEQASTGQPFYSIGEVYSQVPWLAGRVPFWLPAEKGYMFTEAPEGGSFCEGTESAFGITYIGVPGQHYLRGTQQQSVTPFMDFISLCTDAFVDSSHVDTLGHYGYIDPTSGVGLEFILPESATLVHEIAHLVTGNLGYDPKELNLDPLRLMIRDHGSSALRDMLALDPALKADNAESYVYFLVAWWQYYKYKDSGKPAAAFYPGFAVSWDY